MDEGVAEVLDGLRRLNITVTAEEFAEACWLADQAEGWADLPGAAPWATPAAGAAPGTGTGEATTPDGDAPEDGSGRQRPYGSGRDDPEMAPTVVAYLPRRDGDDPDGITAPAKRIRLPDAPALPHAREFARRLRPLRYDARRRHPADGLEEEATALRIAQTRIRLPVPATTRRRRLDLDLVFDIGASGPLWRQLAIELRTVLTAQGAFRSVRSWVLNTDSPGAPELASRDGSRRYPWHAVCEPPRRPMVIILTDGTGQSWRTGAAHGPLREWAARGTLLVVQFLPESMWHRAALRPLSVVFHPKEDDHHSAAGLGVTEAQLSIIRLRRDRLKASLAIPVIGLDPSWVDTWLSLLRGSQAGAVPGYALLVPPPGEQEPERRPSPAGGPRPARVAAARPAPSPERRVRQFMLTASPAARALAELLSVTTPTLPTMRKLRHEFMPDVKPDVLAEVMLGGLLRWPAQSSAATLFGHLDLDFHEGVRDLLRRRPGGAAELAADTARVARALWSAPDSGPGYDAVAVMPGFVGEFLGGEIVTLSPSDVLSPLLPPYPAPVRLEVVEPAVAEGSDVGPDRDAATAPGEEPRDAIDEIVEVPDDAAPVRVGIFGSTGSGRTTFLAILGICCTDWTATPWRRNEQWRIRLASPETMSFVADCHSAFLANGRFPAATIPKQAAAVPLSFLLERRRLVRRRSRLIWRREESLAKVTMTLEDWAGDDFGDAERPANAYQYLAESDVLIYFFDPTYDYDSPRRPRRHSVEYFARAQADLGLAAYQSNSTLHRFLPQHIAVCVPKLDEQEVFDMAVDYGCLRTDPATELPWVPPKHAGRLFEAITYRQRSAESDLLRRLVTSSFDPARTSFHALSSIGFWADEDGDFDEENVCNRAEVLEAESQSPEPEWRLRTPVEHIRPVHVLDPLIAVVERALAQADAR
jgi:hypothetical protein